MEEETKRKETSQKETTKTKIIEENIDLSDLDLLIDEDFEDLGVGKLNKIIFQN